MKLLASAKKAKTAWDKDGATGLRHALSNFRRRAREDRAYRRWMQRNELTPARRAAIREQAASLPATPLISVILPVYNVDEKWLRRCIDSVVDQIYENWELCIADDASPMPHVRAVLDEYVARDSRIKVTYRSENGHISAASNSALELATGEFVVLLDHDDELSPDALFWVANELNEFPDTAIIYSDEDLIDERGRRFGPKFKPDFSRDLFYSLNLLTHLSAYRTDLVRDVGGFRVGLEGSQDYDLGLRVFEQTDESRVRHIPRVLYHWRVIRGSVAFSMDEKPYAHERARQAIREHFERTGVLAEVTESYHNLHLVRYPMPSRPPRVTLIVTEPPGARYDPNNVRLQCAHEALTVDRAPATRTRALNTAAARSLAEVLLFIDCDLTLVAGCSADDLVTAVLQPGIGAAGGRIIDSNKWVESAGMVLRRDLSPAHAHSGFPREYPGNMYRNRQVGNYSAISISCFAVRRELFESVGGFDEDLRPAGLFDVDLCLRLCEQNKRIVVLPHVEFMRARAAPDRQFDSEELRNFQTRWPTYIERDPFCNPNLKRDGSFEIDA